MRKPRESGWRTADGVTHHIDTRRSSAYHAHVRAGTCGVDLRQASRARFDSVDCITCIVRVARRPRLPPRPDPNPKIPSWRTTDGTRHALGGGWWRARCKVSLCEAAGSPNSPNCSACLRGENHGQLSRAQRR
jgi:hypothetical protein